MFFVSTNRQAERVTFREALFRGQPPDRGLYMPEQIPRFTWGDLDRWQGLSYQELAFEISKLWVGDDIADEVLKRVVSAYTWNVPVREIERNVFVLELWHGPTCAFKDFAAQWMGSMMTELSDGTPLTVLAATSGDTGSAVAAGFLNQPGIRVVILYPHGKVSRVQEKQMTSFGQNVKVFAVEGSFDDCQRMVKEAFADESLRRTVNLTSANSINVGRLLPQTIYYIWAYLQVLQDIGKEVVFSIPSGNLGNLTAGLLAQRMGLPVARILAATNRNDVFTEFVHNGRFLARPSVATVSNAMDVGNPSNIVRIFSLYQQEGYATHLDISALHDDVWTSSVDDEATQERIRSVLSESGYILDPHTAVAWEVMARFRMRADSPDVPFIVVGTAHPAKFIEIVEPITGSGTINIPLTLRGAIESTGSSTLLTADLLSLRNVLLGA